MAPIRTSNGSIQVMLFADRLTDKGRARQGWGAKR